MALSEYPTLDLQMFTARANGTVVEENEFTANEAGVIEPWRGYRRNLRSVIQDIIDNAVDQATQHEGELKEHYWYDAPYPPSSILSA